VVVEKFQKLSFDRWWSICCFSDDLSAAAKLVSLLIMASLFLSFIHYGQYKHAINDMVILLQI
jgi:hypothetical protein